MAAYGTKAASLVVMGAISGVGTKPGAMMFTRMFLETYLAAADKAKLIMRVLAALMALYVINPMVVWQRRSNLDSRVLSVADLKNFKLSGRHLPADVVIPELISIGTGENAGWIEIPDAQRILSDVNYSSIWYL